MPAARAAARTVVSELPGAEVSGPMSNGCPQVEAMREQAQAAMEQAKAWHRIADVGEKMIEVFQPAADAVTSLGTRLDALCKWLKGKWPWAALVAYLVISRTINAAPEDVPKLIKAVTDVAVAMSGAH